MIPEELYERYKGRKVTVHIYDRVAHGIIVGYAVGCVWPFIAAVNQTNGFTWNMMDDGDHIIDMIDNELGYIYADMDDMRKIKFGH